MVGWVFAHYAARSGHRMAAETILLPRTGYGAIILTSLKVIRDMSGDSIRLACAGQEAPTGAVLV